MIDITSLSINDIPEEVVSLTHQRNVLLKENVALSKQINSIKPLVYVITLASLIFVGYMVWDSFIDIENSRKNNSHK